jgi:hypothetical protein
VRPNRSTEAGGGLEFTFIDRKSIKDPRKLKILQGAESARAGRDGDPRPVIGGRLWEEMDNVDREGRRRTDHRRLRERD